MLCILLHCFLRGYFTMLPPTSFLFLHLLYLLLLLAFLFPTPVKDTDPVLILPHPLVSSLSLSFLSFLSVLPLFFTNHFFLLLFLFFTYLFLLLVCHSGDIKTDRYNFANIICRTVWGMGDGEWVKLLRTHSRSRYSYKYGRYIRVAVFE